MKQKKYQITCTEEQLRLIANAVEDWHRFLGGQTELWNAVSLLENHHELREKLEQLQPLVRLTDGTEVTAQTNISARPSQ